MNRIAISESISAPIAILGLPIKNLYTYIVSAPTKTFCKIVSRLRFCNSYPETLSYSSLESFLMSYMNMVLKEFEGPCIDGDIEISCSEAVPKVSLIAVVSMEIIGRVLELKRIDYRVFYKTLSIQDEKYFGAMSTYLRSLRCSHLHRSLCISRNMDEDLIYSINPVDVRFIKEYPCRRIPCLNVEDFDSRDIGLHILRIFSQAVVSIAKDLNEHGALSFRTKDIINAVYVIESLLASKSTDLDVEINISKTAKPLLDIDALKFYSIGV